MSKLSRNDPCPCGNGKKFKHCHGAAANPNGGLVSVDLRKLELQERWLLLIEEIHRVLKLPRRFNSADIRACFQTKHVKEINELYDRIINTFANPFVLPRQQGGSLGALYLGDIQERKIRRNILRMSLYADEIYVVDPFMNPHFRTSTMNCALVEPETHILATFQCTYFLLRMYDWLHSGIVTMLLNPAQHDMEYRHAVLSASQQHGDIHLKNVDENELRDRFDAHALLEMFVSIPDARFKAALKATFKGIPDEDASELAEGLIHIRSTRHDLPHAHLFTGAKGQFHSIRGGLSPIDAALVCSQLNAFPFAEYQPQLSLVNALFDKPNPIAQTWSPISAAFKETPLDFLNNVDSDFAISLRKDGRLHTFRRMLSKIWSGVDGDATPTNATILGFADEVRGEYERARIEWDAIRLDAAKWGVATASGIAVGTLALNLPTYLAAGGALLGVYEHWKKTRDFRIRNPASVLVDLNSRD